MQEDRIDLRPYFRTLVARWRLIVTVVVLTTTAAVSMAMQTPPSYAATAGILILRMRTTAAFDSEIRTMTEVEFPDYDRAARRRAMLRLVLSPDVEARVVAALDDEIPPAQREPGTLMYQIEILDNPADMIEVQAHAPQAETAMRLANTWAQEAAAYINETYSAPNNDVVTAISTQLTAAQQHYEEATTALATFQGQTNLAALRSQTLQHQTALQYHNWRKLELAQLLERAELLQEQLGAPGADPATLGPAVALLLTQAASYTPLFVTTEVETEETRAVELHQITPPIIQLGAVAAPRSLESLEAQLETLVASLQSRQAEDGSAAEAATLAQLQTVQQALVQAEDQYRRLAGLRDVAWESYDKLARRAEEMTVNVGIPTTEVRFAISALEPSGPENGGLTRSLLLGLAVGLLLGVAGAFLADLVAGGTRRLVPASAR